MKYTIQQPKWNNHLHRYEANVLSHGSAEVIAIGVGEIAMEATDRAEIIAEGFRLYYESKKDNTPASSHGVMPA